MRQATKYPTLFFVDIPIHPPLYFLNSLLVTIKQYPQTNYALRVQFLIIVVMNCCPLVSNHPFCSAHHLCNKQKTARATVPPLPPTLFFCSLSLRYSNNRISNHSTFATLPRCLGRKSWLAHQIGVSLVHNQVTM